jgi:hypothetical protein
MICMHINPNITSKACLIFESCINDPGVEVSRNEAIVIASTSDDKML